MLAVAGVTITDATGIGVTVTAAVPLLPSVVAVIVTGPPTALPVPRPLASPVATAASLLAHVTGRPVSALPFASFGVAVSWTVAFICTLGVAGVTSTDATGTCETVIAAVPFLPSLVAVIVTGPAAFAVTRPFASTVATVALLVCHVTTRPVSGVPAASFGVAVSCTGAPTTTLADGGLTSTDATAMRVWQAVEPASVNVCPAMGMNCHE